MTAVPKINPEATMRSGIAVTIIAGLFLMLPSVSAHARVTGVTFEPKSPIVGHSVTAIATDDQKHKVVKWIWDSHPVRRRDSRPDRDGVHRSRSGNA